MSLPSKRQRRSAPGHVVIELLKKKNQTELHMKLIFSHVHPFWTVVGSFFLADSSTALPTTRKLVNNLYSCGIGVGKCWCPLAQRAKHAK